MKKNLVKTLTLALVLTSASFVGGTSVYAADTYGTVDVNGYGEDEIQATAQSKSGVLFDGGWYAPDGKFYTYVDANGTLGNTLIACEVKDGKAVLTAAQTATLTKMGLDHNQQADAVADNPQVPSYMQMIGGNKFTAENVSKALADNLKFNSDLIRTVSEWEEADRKATDKFLYEKIEAIDMAQEDNTLKFKNGKGEEKSFNFTDTTNDSLSHTRINDDIKLSLTDSAGNTVDTTLQDIGKASDIRNVKNDSVTSVIKTGDTVTVIKGDGTESSFDDIHINDFQQTTDGSGKFTSTITTNEIDPATGINKTYESTIDISDYVKENASNADLTIIDKNTQTEIKTTIGDQVQNNYNEITHIKNNYVSNVTAEKDTLTFTQIIDGSENKLEYTDKHITALGQTLGSYDDANTKGKITTTITTNEIDPTTAANKTYESTVDISDYVSAAIKNESADATLIINEIETTIGDQIITNTNELNKGWNAQVDGQTVNTVKMGDAQNFVSGDNIILTGDDSGNITVSTKQEVSFSQVTIGNTTITDNSINVGSTIHITDNGINMGDTKITNVRAGDIYQGSQDAVNAGQLWDTNRRLDSLSGRINKVGAGAAALAALHPMDFDPDDKLNFAAGVGNYGGSTASALGIFYRPNEKVMFNLAGTLGNGENMVNAGISFALGKGGKVNDSKVAMAHEIADLRSQVAELTAMVNSLIGNSSYDFSGSPLLFPDVPANHWAYEYIDRLSAAGIIEGYPDGSFGGDRTMTRYEFAAMLYRALANGAVLDARLMHEFEAELGRIRIDRIRGENLDKVERIRIITADDRDHYGSK